MRLLDKPVRLGRFEVVAPDFFFIPSRLLRLESDQNVNRTYLLKGERIVAVGRRKEAEQ